MNQVCVIGAGKWGRNIVRTLNELGALGAVIEASSELRKDLQTDFPEAVIGESLTDIPEGISAVAIATPVPTHYAVAKQCLDKGMDVFVEKPMTLNVEEARELHQIAANKDRILMVGHMLLYQPAIRWIHSFLKEGGVGTVLSLHQERLNLGRARKVENALWSLGVHDVAVLLHLVGEEPSSVYAKGQAALQPEIHDDVYLHLKFPNKVQAHLHTSWLWPERRRQLTIVGDRAMLVFDELAQKVTLHKKSIDGELNNVDEGTEVAFEQKGQPLTLEMEDFLARIKDRETPLADGTNGLQVVRVLETATRLLNT